MRKVKEEKVIEHSDGIMKELHKVYKEGIGVDEYSKLLTEYKKLYKRYHKTIKLGDTMGNQVMDKNELLQDNLQYTISKARDKLMDNVVEHRKTKEVSSNYRAKSKVYEDALRESYAENKKLEKKITQYVKTFGEIESNIKKTSTDSNNITKKINPREFDKITIEQLVSLELSKGKQEFVIINLALKNFNQMIETIEESSSLNNFLIGISKYIVNILDKSDIIYHFKDEEFFIITKDRNIDEINSLIQKLNQKRKVLGFDIQFTIGMTQYKDKEDTTETLLKRCKHAFFEAQEAPSAIVIK